MFSLSFVKRGNFPVTVGSENMAVTSLGQAPLEEVPSNRITTLNRVTREDTERLVKFEF